MNFTNIPENNTTGSAARNNNNNNNNNNELINTNQTVPGSKNTDNNNNNDNQNNNDTNDTNKLYTLLSQQEQPLRDNNNNTNNNSATSTNFYAITQYILQSYYKVDFNNLLDLKLIDLIVDQTYPDSLTLRKLNDTDTLQTYQYFNTISRHSDISRCPMFALSVYFVIRWSHPNPPITTDNFKYIKLLDSNYVTYDSNPMKYIQNHLNGNVNSTTKIPRSTIFEPSEHLINLVFPWLYNFKQDVLLIDRTNYTLHSLCELFDFMGKIIIQDLRYLNQHSLLLPNIVTFMSKFIPEVLEDPEFKGFQNTFTNIPQQNDTNNNNNNFNINNDALMNDPTNLMGNSNNNSNNNNLMSINRPLDSTGLVFNSNNNSNVINTHTDQDLQLSQQNLSSQNVNILGNDNIPNDYVNIQTFNNTTNVLSQNMDNRFTELSRKLTTENIRLSQQVTQLKTELSSLSSMCSQMIQLQRQMISGQNAVLSNNNMNNNNMNNNNAFSDINSGILIVDKNSLTNDSFQTIIQSLRDDTRNNENNNNNNNNNSMNVTASPRFQSSVLAPLKSVPNALNNNNNNNIQPLSMMSPSNQQVVSPSPVIYQSPPGASSLNQVIGQISAEPKEKRKLPLPTTNNNNKNNNNNTNNATILMGSVGSPFSVGSPGSISGIDSPFSKKIRLDDKPTPSQTALDSLLFKSNQNHNVIISNNNNATNNNTNNPINLAVNSPAIPITTGLVAKHNTEFLINGSSSESETTTPSNNKDVTDKPVPIEKTEVAKKGDDDVTMEKNKDRLDINVEKRNDNSVTNTMKNIDSNEKIKEAPAPQPINNVDSLQNVNPPSVSDTVNKNMVVSGMKEKPNIIKEKLPTSKELHRNTIDSSSSQTNQPRINIPLSSFGMNRANLMVQRDKQLNSNSVFNAPVTSSNPVKIDKLDILNESERYKNLNIQNKSKSGTPVIKTIGNNNHNNDNNNNNKTLKTIKEFTVVQSQFWDPNNPEDMKMEQGNNTKKNTPKIQENRVRISTINMPDNTNIIVTSNERSNENKREEDMVKQAEKLNLQVAKKAINPNKLNPNENIKYKLSRENKTIWDLYAEWYIGIDGKPPIKKLIEEYGWRRWKVTEDSHFFPTRKVIMQYIETECDRGIKLGRFVQNDQSREDIRKIVVSDLEKFRINNSLTLNSLSLYFRNLTKKNKELCIFNNFNTWQIKNLTDAEKIKYSKRKHGMMVETPRRVIQIQRP